MDDQTFNDPKTALEWIHLVESEKGQSIRNLDIYPRLRNWTQKNSFQTILDIGCGQGICSDQVDLDHCSYVGVDPSPDLVRRAKDLYQDRTKQFIEGSIYSLPFSNDSFDAAFSVAVWHLLKDLKKAAHELSRILRPCGQFLIITANPDAYDSWMAPYTEKHIEGQRFDGKIQRSDQSIIHDVLYLYTLDEMINSFQKVGLKILQTKSFRPSEKHKKQDLFISIQGQK